jgi:hypothetical protein
MAAIELAEQHLTVERQTFAIRKLATPSKSSKGKRTATGSEESSLEMKESYG